MGLIKDIWELIKSAAKKRPASDLVALQQMYRGMVEDLRKELDERRRQMEVIKLNDPAKTLEVDECIRREEKLGQELIKAWQEIKDLQGQLVFTRKELDTLKKKHRSMYE